MATTLYSNVYSKQAYGRWGVYPVKTFGYITVPTSTSFILADVLYVCYIPPNSYVADFIFDFPVGLDGGAGSATLTMGLLDNSSASAGGTKPGGTTAETSAITYFTAAAMGTKTTNGRYAGNMTTADIASGILGTTYAASQVLSLVVTGVSQTANSGAKQINFCVGFAPV